jgi:pimeloyl-ACP methyl ester carboxylesterase
VTARSVASLFDYEPPLDWTRVETPVLALVGAGDEMVSAEFSRAAVAAARPPRSELRVLPDCGHLLFHDHLADVLPLLVEWLGVSLAPAAGPAATEEAARAR